MKRVAETDLYNWRHIFLGRTLFSVPNYLWYYSKKEHKRHTHHMLKTGAEEPLPTALHCERHHRPQVQLYAGVPGVELQETFGKTRQWEEVSEEQRIKLAIHWGAVNSKSNLSHHTYMLYRWSSAFHWTVVNIVQNFEWSSEVFICQQRIEIVQCW